MAPVTPDWSYAIVSPVKDEARHVERTLRSVAAQTLPPARWVIVDDGSADETPEIIRRYADRYGFIRIITTDSAGARQTGGAVIRAFNAGLATLDDAQYGFIVKLDCDLSFEPNYFEKLLERFRSEPSLGIASGVYLECSARGEWRRVRMPPYHAFGACKVIRRRCFDDIGGFVVSAGWDTVDEIRAWARGWRTGHFVDLEVRHHKREGSGIGQVRTSRMHGEIYYRTGGDPLFFLGKVLHRLTARPPLINAAALSAGYLSALVQGQPLLVTDAEKRCYRRVLRRRVLSRLRQGDAGARG